MVGGFLCIKDCKIYALDLGISEANSFRVKKKIIFTARAQTCPDFPGYKIHVFYKVSQALLSLM